MEIYRLIINEKVIGFRHLNTERLMSSLFHLYSTKRPLNYKMMIIKFIPTAMFTALFALIFSSFISAGEATAEERDFKVKIRKKGDTYPTKHDGEIETVYFEITAEADDRAINDPSSISIKYEIFYYEDSVSLKRGGIYKSIIGSLDLGADREIQKIPLRTDSVKIHDTVEIESNLRNRNRSADEAVVSNVTGERKDKLIGILVDFYQSGELIASYSDRSRIVKLAKKLRKEEKPITPEAIK